MTHMIKDLNAVTGRTKAARAGVIRRRQRRYRRVHKVALETRDRAAGRKYGLDYAEEFHYIGPDRALDEYLSQHAAPL